MYACPNKHTYTYRHVHTYTHMRVYTCKTKTRRHPASADVWQPDSLSNIRNVDAMALLRMQESAAARGGPKKPEMQAKGSDKVHSIMRCSSCLPSSDAHKRLTHRRSRYQALWQQSGCHCIGHAAPVIRQLHDARRDDVLCACRKLGALLSRGPESAPLRRPKLRTQRRLRACKTPARARAAASPKRGAENRRGRPRRWATMPARTAATPAAPVACCRLSCQRLGHPTDMPSAGAPSTRPTREPNRDDQARPFRPDRDFRTTHQRWKTTKQLY